MRARLLIAALVAALAACDRTAAPGGEPSEAAFSHAATADLSGYYRPVAPVRIGEAGLEHVFIGQMAAFESWQGGSRAGAFAPVMIQFADAGRVLPTRYEVSDTAVVFEGRSPELGRVRFEGQLDPGALATARRNLGGDGVVMTGTLTAAGQTVRDVRLRWWMGD